MRAIFRAPFAARRRASPTPVAKSLGRAALARAFDFISSSLTRATEIEPGSRRTSLPFAGRSQGPCVATVSYPCRIRPCPPCNYVSERQTRLAGLSCLLLSCSVERLTRRHRLSLAVLIQSSMPSTDRRDLAPSYAGTARASGLDLRLGSQKAKHPPPGAWHPEGRTSICLAILALNS